MPLDSTGKAKRGIPTTGQPNMLRPGEATPVLLQHCSGRTIEETVNMTYHWVLEVQSLLLDKQSCNICTNQEF